MTMILPSKPLVRMVIAAVPPARPAPTTTYVWVNEALSSVCANRTKYDYSVSHHAEEELARKSMSNITAVNLLEVDRNKCCGYGMCAEVCPEVFSLDENGFVVANMTEIPEELMESAEEAVYCCPEDVLKITKSES
jgi:ferredoxin